MYNGNHNDPKDDEDRLRTNPPVFHKVPVRWDGIQRGPDLPENYEWCERTQEWWAMWRNSPQSMVMLDSDWEVMLETAYLHHMLWRREYTLAGIEKFVGGTTAVNLASEIRRRVSSFGATFEDRAKLRMSITTPNDGNLDDIEIDNAVDEVVDYASKLAKKAAERLS